jgi:hypothetical protein
MDKELIKSFLPLLDGMGINPQSILDGVKPQIIKAILDEEILLQKNIFITANLTANKDDVKIKIYIIDETGNKLYKEINIDEFLKNIL